MKIVIVGLGKSGTTALFYRIKNSKNFETLFEPNSLKKIQALEGCEDVLVKNLILNHLDFSLQEAFDAYDKKIHIVRDPRDNLISRLLYKASFVSLYNRAPEEIKEFFKLLEQKAFAKSRVSVKRLFDYLDTDFDTMFARFDDILAFDDQNFFILHYEDFVDDSIRELEEYLGFALVKEFEVGKEFSRVTRSKASGSWRLWFTPEDVEFFKPKLEPFMRAFHYDMQDWTLHSNSTIPKEHAQEYFLRVLNEKREQEGLERIEIA